mgnify:CR=1 FL=1
MTELEKIAYAKTYIEKLANGINPLTGQPVPDSDSINNVRISRCLFYVSDLLRRIVENGGMVQQKAGGEKLPFQLNYEDRKKFRYSETPISISEVAKRINELIQPEEMKKLNYKFISDWLIQAGFLVVVQRDDGKTTKKPTEDGRRLGIATEQRQGSRGIYTVVIYNKAAQQFILDNLDAAIELSQR